MSQHDDITSLKQMLQHAREVSTILQGRSRDDLDNDRLLNLALVRLLEIIGEAAGRVTDRTRENNPQIEWRQIVGMRNRLIHAYDDVDFDILWMIVTVDIPRLVNELTNMLDSNEL